MNTFTQDKINEILRLHLLWLENKEDGVRANLEYANLESANLKCANLKCANLESANLESANLESANLKCANLKCANLESANLESANLESANLKCANLESANLKYANLKCANLDFSQLNFSCKSLKTKFDEKHIIQILYHAAKPCQYHNEIVKDTELLELLKSELFKKVVNKFHQVDETGKFEL